MVIKIAFRHFTYTSRIGQTIIYDLLIRLFVTKTDNTLHIPALALL